MLGLDTIGCWINAQVSGSWNRMHSCLVQALYLLQLLEKYVCADSLVDSALGSGCILSGFNSHWVPTFLLFIFSRYFLYISVFFSIQLFSFFISLFSFIFSLDLISLTASISCF